MKKKIVWGCGLLALLALLVTTTTDAVAKTLPKPIFTSPKPAEVEVLVVSQSARFQQVRSNAFFKATLSYLVRIKINDEEYYSFGGVGHRETNDRRSGAYVNFVYDVAKPGLAATSVTASPDNAWGISLVQTDYGRFGLFARDDLPDGVWMKGGKAVRGDATLRLPFGGEIAIEITRVRKQGEYLRAYTNKKATQSIEFRVVDTDGRIPKGGDSGSVIVQNGVTVGVLSGIRFGADKIFYGVSFFDMYASHQRAIREALEELRAEEFQPLAGMEVLMGILAT